MLSYISKWFDSTSNNNSGAYSFRNCRRTSFIEEINFLPFGFPVVFHTFFVWEFSLPFFRVFPNSDFLGNFAML